jgi:hypothetical protein
VKTKSDYFKEGWNAVMNESKGEDDNPYPRHSEKWEIWREGWYSAKYDGIEY